MALERGGRGRRAGARLTAGGSVTRCCCGRLALGSRCCSTLLLVAWLVWLPH